MSWTITLPAWSGTRRSAQFTRLPMLCSHKAAVTREFLSRNTRLHLLALQQVLVARRRHHLRHRPALLQ